MLPGFAEENMCKEYVIPVNPSHLHRYTKLLENPFQGSRRFVYCRDTHDPTPIFLQDVIAVVRLLVSPTMPRIKHGTSGRA